jgi:hypothetical protein
VGVPLLFIGNRALSGSRQIPDELPGLIDQHLAAGGVDFPEVSGLKAYLIEHPVLDEDEELCELNAPCPSETEEASYPPPVALPAISSAGSTGSYPPPPPPLPYIPPEEQVVEAPAAAREASPTPPDRQVVFQPVEAAVDSEQSGQGSTFPFIPAAVGVVLVIAAFVLYNVIKARQSKSPQS